MHFYTISIPYIYINDTNTIITTSWQNNVWCPQTLLQGYPRLLGILEFLRLVDLVLTFK